MVILQQPQEFSWTHWLIFIINKQQTLEFIIYANLCEVDATSENSQLTFCYCKETN